MSRYREVRDPYLYGIFKDLDTVGKFDMPVVAPTHNDKVFNLLPFNYWNSCPCPKEYYLCFYVDDYQFERIWNDPYRWAEVLKQFKGIIAPDFSMYRDFPRMLQIYNCWRNKVMSAFFQKCDIEVIPNVTWSDEASFKYAFDGLPMHSVVAVSTNGCIRDEVARKLLLQGFERMKRKLEPEKVIVFGHLPKEWENEPNIIHFESYTSLLKCRAKEKTYKRKE